MAEVTLFDSNTPTLSHLAIRPAPIEVVRDCRARPLAEMSGDIISAAWRLVEEALFGGLPELAVVPAVGADAVCSPLDEVRTEVVANADPEQRRDATERGQPVGEDLLQHVVVARQDVLQGTQRPRVKHARLHYRLKVKDHRSNVLN